MLIGSGRENVVAWDGGLVVSNGGADVDRLSLAPPFATNEGLRMGKSGALMLWMLFECSIEFLRGSVRLTFVHGF